LYAISFGDGGIPDLLLGVLEEAVLKHLLWYEIIESEN